VELPTYTNIWKIEKRLYKLYDFRLPMPLPVGQIAAYLAIAAPYMVVLTLVGVPFSHTWLWIYLLPPGVLAWLVTRPVLEGKRLPELVQSQLRYLSEPRTWCRLSPLAEKDDMVLVARVWRSAGYVRPAAQPVPAARPVSALQLATAQLATAPLGAAPLATEQPGRAQPARARRPTRQRSAVPLPAAELAPEPAAWRRPGFGPSQSAAGEVMPVRARAAEAAPRMAARQVQATAPAQPVQQSQPAQPVPQSQPGQPVPQAQPVPPVQPGRAGAQSQPIWPTAPQVSAADAGVATSAAGTAPAVPVLPGAVQSRAVPPGAVRPGAVQPGGVQPAPAQPALPVGPGQASRPEAKRPAVRVTGDASVTRPLNVVERALRTQPGTAGFRDHVVVVPGGHRPGKPDQVQRDRARAALPLAGPVRIVVLGCTSGAGQTIVTLLTGQLLASLRGEAVAVLDLNRGQGSLTEQARFIPALMPSRLVGAGTGQAAGAGERGLQVVTAGDSNDDPGQIISAVAARYPLTLADPEASCVPRTLRAADQLILVAPASAEAPESLAMTLEWLEAHDHAALAAGAITVLNGVSPQSAAHAERAATVASGRSRATVRVPWDERMQGRQALGTATMQAYTALAGVLIASVADATVQPGLTR
jgi:hypothetical protein